MSYDDNMRELLLKLISEEEPEFTSLYELYSHCFAQYKLALEFPEKEIEVLTFNQIREYYDFDNEFLRRILRTEVFSGAGLVSGLKAGNIQAHYIYQLYRLFTELDRRVIWGIIKNDPEGSEYFYKLETSLKKLNAVQREPIDEKELLDQYWHFVMKYGYDAGVVSNARKESFGKCYSQFLEIFKSSNNDIAALKSYVDGLIEN